MQKARFDGKKNRESPQLILIIIQVGSKIVNLEVPGR